MVLLKLKTNVLAVIYEKKKQQSIDLLLVHDPTYGTISQSWAQKIFY